MTSKHTPGPWYVTWLNEVCAGAPTMAGASGGHICRPEAGKDRHGAPNPKEMAEANARLIAAAPELLAFAQTVTEFDGRNNITHLKQLAAEVVAKAKGV